MVSGIQATLSDDELNEESLKALGLTDSDIAAVLGESMIIDAEVVELHEDSQNESGVTDPSTDSAIDSDSERISRLPARILEPTYTEKPGSTKVYAQWTEEWWQHAKAEVKQRRCKAHRKDGGQCLKAAINGATVCRYHGGAAKHVKQAARARLENAADRMAKELLGMAIDPNVSDSVKLAAIKDALDRGGLKPTEQVVLSAGVQTGYEEIFDDISTTTRAESRRVRGIEDDDTESIDYQGDSHPHPAMSAEPPNHADYQQDSTDNGECPDIQRRESDSSGPESTQNDDVDDHDGSPRPRPKRRSAGQSGPHITGEDAIRIANRANFATGALKALPPGRSG